jgi:hypothetical protein
VDIVALIISVIALVIALAALLMSFISLRTLWTTLVDRDLERSFSQTTSGTRSGEQAAAARTFDASKRVSATAFLDVPALSPETIAPLLGRPPMPKGGFGTKVVTKRDS